MPNDSALAACARLSVRMPSRPRVSTRSSCGTPVMESRHFGSGRALAIHKGPDGADACQSRQLARRELDVELPFDFEYEPDMRRRIPLLDLGAQGFLTEAVEGLPEVLAEYLPQRIAWRNLIRVEARPYR